MSIEQYNDTLCETPRIVPIRPDKQLRMKVGGDTDFESRVQRRERMVDRMEDITTTKDPL